MPGEWVFTSLAFQMLSITAAGLNIDFKDPVLKFCKTLNLHLCNSIFTFYLYVLLFAVAALKILNTCQIY